MSSVVERKLYDTKIGYVLGEECRTNQLTYRLEESSQVINKSWERTKSLYFGSRRVDDLNTWIDLKAWWDIFGFYNLSIYLGINPEWFDCHTLPGTPKGLHMRPGCH